MSINDKIADFIERHGATGKTYAFPRHHSNYFVSLVYEDMSAEEEGEEPELEWLEYTDSPEDYGFEVYGENGNVQIWVEALDGTVRDQDMCNGIMYGVVRPIMNLVEIMESTYEPMDESLTIEEVENTLLSIGLSKLQPA